MGLLMPTYTALKTPVVEASAPQLHTLCLAVLSKHLNKLSLDMGDFLENGQKSGPPRPFHGLTMAHLQGIYGHLPRHQNPTNPK